MAECRHERVGANVVVTHLEDIGRTMADVTVWCEDCRQPFRFIGLPSGVDYNGASVSVDGTEARLAMATKGEVITQLDEKTPAGFTVRRTV